MIATIGLGADCIAPTVEAIRAGRYPLTRPLYMYVARAALEQLRVRSLAQFTVEHSRELVSTVRTIVPAEPAALERSAERLPPAPIPDG